MFDKKGVTRVRGVVKWFDVGRGFGFVVGDDGGPDILLHINVLRNFGQSSIADGAKVDITAQRTDRGVQALEIHAIDAPRPAGPATLADFQEIDESQLRALPLEPARVKWFDKGKGFGFANVFGSSDDVFLHIEVLRASGLADLSPGEAIAIRQMDGRRGKMAMEVRQWEAALEPEPEV
ncbi:cold-shock protein [Oceanicola sp. 22II-s10i]|uniref:cold-shock protein n=1 Tax=Oceanicola sp. 22II-s10i TaxID=1317116 RepID=UPI000B5288EA|nr:cold shock domain-containing protein [Oceanicola sp. 22II-s10i]OWU83836.1 cold-shock protein [Oceanicola sp. 22II-s10i]